MRRAEFLKTCGSLAMLALAPRRLGANTPQSVAPGGDPHLFSAQGWPTYFHLDPGESLVVRNEGRSWRVKLLALRTRHTFNRRVRTPRGPRLIAEEEADVLVDGLPLTLHVRPNQMPLSCAGARLAFEGTREQAEEVDFAALPGFTRRARFALRAADLPWGPASLRFPLLDYRWHSSTFLNPWGAIVPSDRVYYHRGEDFGAVPDRVAVIASLDGTVTQSPLPEGDGASNAVFVTSLDGVSIRTSHFNLASLSPAAALGTSVRAGQRLGLAGHTRDGKEVMLVGAHLHWDLRAAGTRLGSLPYAVEAYFRDYPDPLLPLTPGFLYAEQGDIVTLDGGRALARPGESISRHEWHLADGRVIKGDRTRVLCDTPGVHTHELRVFTPSGAEARAHCEMAVWPPGNSPGDLPRGWLLVHPARDPRPGDLVEILFGCVDYAADSRIDFGDGSKPRLFRDLVTHRYRRPGWHTLTITTPGPTGLPMVRKTGLLVAPS